MHGPGPYRTRIPDGLEDGFYRLIEGNEEGGVVGGWGRGDFDDDDEYDATTEELSTADSLDTI